MKKLVFAVSACVLALGLGASAFAANFGGPGFVPGPALTPEQQQQAQTIYNENFASMENARQQLQAKRAELDALLGSPNPDKNRIRALSREIGELRGELLASRSDVRAQLQQNGLPGDYYGDYGPRNGYRHGRAPRSRWHHRDGHHYRMGMGMCGCNW